MSNPTFEARDLWASQGVPYYEPDKIEVLTVRRTMLRAATLRGEFGLIADAEVVTP